MKQHAEKEREVRRALVKAWHALILCGADLTLQHRAYLLTVVVLYLPIGWKDHDAG